MMNVRFITSYIAAVFLAFCFAPENSNAESKFGTAEEISAKQAQEFAKTFVPTGIGSEEFQRVRVMRDLEFARYGDEKLLLDMYLPAEAQAPVPCVVTITGGGFKARGKDAFARYAAFLSTQGFAAACISYRGAPDHTYLSTIQDCKAAVRFVRANAGPFGVNPEQIGAFGQSAGGHLSGMLAVSDDVKTFEGDGGNAGISSRVQAAVCFAGVFDFISRLRNGGHQKKSLEVKKATNGAWIGEPFSESSEAWKQASPINHLSKDDPPILLVHTKTDTVVPYAQSMQMHEAMQAAGLTSKLMILEEGGHSVSRSKAINKEVWDETIQFLRTHLNFDPNF